MENNYYNKYLKYKKKYLELVHKGGVFFTHPEFNEIVSIGFEHESSTNCIPLEYEIIGTTITFTGLGVKGEKVLIKVLDNEELKITSDTAVIKYKEYGTSFKIKSWNQRSYSVFNFNQIIADRRLKNKITPFNDTLFGNFDNDTIDYILNFNNDKLFCQPEFIHTYYNVSSDPNIFCLKYIDSITQIINYLKRLPICNIQIDVSSSLYKKLKILSDSTSSSGNSKIRSIDLLMDEDRKIAYLVYSNEDFNLRQFKVSTELESYFFFNKIFHTQVTFGSKIENIYKIINIIEKPLEPKSIEKKIIDYLVSFKNYMSRQIPSVNDADISKLFLILQRLFLLYDDKEGFYKFYVNYSVRHLFNDIFDFDPDFMDIIGELIKYIEGTKPSFYNINPKIITYYKTRDDINDDLVIMPYARGYVDTGIHTYFEKNIDHPVLVKEMKKHLGKALNLGKIVSIILKLVYHEIYKDKNYDVKSSSGDYISVNVTHIKYFLNNDDGTVGKTDLDTQIYPIKESIILMEVRDKSTLFFYNGILHWLTKQPIIKEVLSKISPPRLIYLTKSKDIIDMYERLTDRDIAKETQIKTQTWYEYNKKLMSILDLRNIMSNIDYKSLVEKMNFKVRQSFYYNVRYDFISLNEQFTNTCAQGECDVEILQSQLNESNILLQEFLNNQNDFLKVTPQYIVYDLKKKIDWEFLNSNILSLCTEITKQLSILKNRDSDMPDSKKARKEFH